MITEVDEYLVARLISRDNHKIVRGSRPILPNDMSVLALNEFWRINREGGLRTADSESEKESRFNESGEHDYESRVCVEEAFEGFQKSGQREERKEVFPKTCDYKRRVI